MSGWTLVILVVASATPMIAHHSLSGFDTTKAVTVKGPIVLIQKVNPHSFVFIEQLDTRGRIERWAVEGPTPNFLSRTGLERALKVGDVVEACGYVMKADFELRRVATTGPSSKTISGRVITAETLVLADGKKTRWSDYGHHLCFPPDYDDGHRHVGAPR